MPTFRLPFRKTDVEKYGTQAVLGGSIASQTGTAGLVETSRLHAGAITAADVSRFLSDHGLETFRAADLAPGELAHAYAVHGWGMTGSVEVDLASLVAPGFLTLAVKGRVQAEVADAMLVGLMHFQTIERLVFPYQLLVMSGSTFSCEGSIGVEAGVKVGLANLGVSGADAEREERSLNIAGDSSGSVKALEWSLLKVELKAVASVAIGGTIHSFVVGADAPLVFADHTDPALGTYLGALLGGGSKKDLKVASLRFLETVRSARPALGVSVPEANAISSRLWDARPKLALIKSSLEHVASALEGDPVTYPAADPSVLAHVNEAKYHSMLLGHLRDRAGEGAGSAVRSTQRDRGASSVGAETLKRVCLLTVSATERQATGRLEARAEASIVGQGAEAGVALTAQVAERRSTSRFQTYAMRRVRAGATERRDACVFTQDAAIRYRTVKRELTAEAAASFLTAQASKQGRAPAASSAPPVVAATRVPPPPASGAMFLQKQTLSYTSRTVLWDYPPDAPATTPPAAPTIVHAGVARGESVTWKTLKELAALPLVEFDPFGVALAATLGVEVGALDQFLVPVQAQAATLESGFGLADHTDVLIEATFTANVPAASPEFFERTDGVWRLKATEFPDGTLKSIRLRIRHYDLLDESATRFKLGVKLAYVAELKIELEEVSRAGRCATETILNFGVGPTAPTVPGTDPPIEPAETILFHL